MADKTIYGCFVPELGQPWFYDGCCIYPACRLISGLHNGQSNIIDPGQCEGAYYGCFKPATGQHELILPDNCCHGSVWKIGTTAGGLARIVWIYDTGGLQHANGIRLDASGNVFVGYDNYGGAPYDNYVKLDNDGNQLAQGYDGVKGQRMHITPSGISYLATESGGGVQGVAAAFNASLVYQNRYNGLGTGPNGFDCYLDGSYLYVAKSEYTGVEKFLAASPYTRQCSNSDFEPGYEICDYGGYLWVAGQRVLYSGNWRSVWKIDKSDCSTAGGFDTGGYARGLFIDGDGNFYVAMYRNNNLGSWASVAKFNSSFVLQWSYDTGGHARGITKVGNYVYVAGVRNNASGKYESVWKLKDTGGTPPVEKVWGFDTCDDANDVDADADHCYVAAERI